MEVNFFASTKMPQAYVAINKSRLKSYENNSVYYLNDKTEFQLELFNPTQETLLTKIKLNGKNISQGGLILKPGERIFLDRYLDVAKKFLFETYEVDGENTEVREAIKNNGTIAVEFFKEMFVNNVNIFTTNLPWNNGGFNRHQPYTPYYNANFEYNTITCNNSLDNKLSSNQSSNVSKSIETGTIEMGGKSNQKFTSVSKNFTTFPFHTVKSKILPISQKINEISEVIKVAKYCTSCGYKVNHKDKYCGQCGNKL